MCDGVLKANSDAGSSAPPHGTWHLTEAVRCRRAPTGVYVKRRSACAIFVRPEGQRDVYSAGRQEVDRVENGDGGDVLGTEVKAEYAVHNLLTKRRRIHIARLHLAH